MKHPIPPNRPSRVGAAMGALALLSACAGPPRRTDVALLLGRSEAIAKVVRPAWTEIRAARERGEPLDANYVADVGDVYLTTITADIELLGAIADRRSLSHAAKMLDAANDNLERMVRSHKLGTPSK